MGNRIPTLDAPPLWRYGLPEMIKQTAPAAGADWTYQVTGHDYLRLVSLTCKLVTSATVASREVVVSYETTSGNRFGLYGINTTVTASQTAYYHFSAFQPEAVATVDSTALVPLGPILLSPTQVIKLHVVNVQAADQLSEIRTVWERFYTTDQPPVGFPVSV
jgi:hypothetical protein